MTGGPGSCRKSQTQRAAAQIAGCVSISPGDYLSRAAQDKSDKNWQVVNDALSRGEMAPEVCVSRGV